MNHFSISSLASYSLRPARWLVTASLLALAALATGCATGPNPRDPYESFNRGVFDFNVAVDDAVLKPVATAYKDVTPAFVRTSVSNFFGNLSDMWSFVNSVLQLKGAHAAETFMRVNMNTFFGMAGLFDIASEMNLERHREDFGQTLGHWGVPSGPYLMLPLLGPSTVRDTVALPVDMKGDLVQQVNPAGSRIAFGVTRVVDQRSNLLRASALLEQAALDKYTFTRDVYLQRRRAAVLENTNADADTGGRDAPAK